MARVYHQRELLTDSQICILTDTYCHRYNTWEARDEIHNVQHNMVQSNYYIYKSSCKYRGGRPTEQIPL